MNLVLNQSWKERKNNQIYFNMIYITADPGAKGAIVATEKGKMVKKIMMPLKDDGSVDTHEISLFIAGVLLINRDFKVIGAIEEIHSLHGMSAKSNFNFGRNFQAVISAFDVSLKNWEFVKAKEWQKEIFGDMEVILNKKGKKDTKAMSIKRATELFPDADLTPTERAKKPSDGIADALCMAEYLRRKYEDL